MEGIKNLLYYLNDNWSLILVCLGLLISITKQTMNFFSKSDEEKIEIAKQQISEAMLKMISDAEENYQSWSQAGAIKRSQVIEQIFAEYPILSKALDQDEIIEWIDEEIDNALLTLREIIKTNAEEKTE